MTLLHTSRAYEAELKELHQALLLMGSRCEKLLEDASRAFEDRDVALAAEVQTGDKLVDYDEMRIDELAVRILALRQPAGRDLRFLVTAIKVVTDLERIGDEAANVAERASQIAEQGEAPPALRERLHEMAHIAKQVVHEALEAFVRSDEAAARAVLGRDDEVDALYGEMLRSCMDFIQRSPEHVEMAMCIASTSKYLERIGDHATNIAEMVVYMTSGQQVRHLAKR